MIGIGELARSCRVSAQHCRDLETMGVLPPARRTSGGHRRYTDSHVAALQAYESLARAHGNGRAGEIVKLVNRDQIDDALESVDQRHAVIHRQRAKTREVIGLLQGRVGAPLGRVGRALTISEAATALDLTTSTLRHWEAEGLVTPERDPHNGYRRYRASTLRRLAIVRMLRDAGYPVEQVREVAGRLDSDDPERAIELARHRLRELADATRAAVAAEAELWAYLQHRGDVEVRPVGTHLLHD
jgi:DNA-binding transcriptional MerR regulator